MRTYDLIVNTYELGGKTPVVTHIFRGKTPEQAKGFCRAHLKSDRFFKDCGKGKRQFNGMKCRNQIVGMFYGGRRVG